MVRAAMAALVATGAVQAVVAVVQWRQCRPADGSDKPPGAGGAMQTAVKRVRKDAPAAADGKGE